MTQSYSQFLNILRSPGCKEILVNIRGFIRKFSEFSHSGANPQQLSHIYSNYIKGQILPSLLENTSFRAQCGVLSCPSFCIQDNHIQSCPNYLLAKDGLEYMITSQIHPFSFRTPEDEATNDWLNRKIMLLSTFIEEENLDIKPDDDEVSLAIKEISSLSSLSTPFDLRNLLLNVCKILNSSTKSTPNSMDILLPTLIWTLIKANTTDLHFILLFISRYEIDPLLSPLDSFLWTAIEASKSFLIDCDHQSFTKDGKVMDLEFYELQMSQADNKIKPPLPKKQSFEDLSSEKDEEVGDEKDEDEESIQEFLTNISKDSFTIISKWVGEAQDKISKKIKNANTNTNTKNIIPEIDDIDLAIINSLETKEVEDAFEKDNIAFSDVYEPPFIDEEPEECSSSIINDYCTVSNSDNEDANIKIIPCDTTTNRTAKKKNKKSNKK